VAAVGIDAETAAKLLELVKADAAAHGGTVRTKRVLKAAEAKGLDINGAAVKILAGFAGLQIERGPGKGEGTPSGTGGRMGGRPPNSKDAQKRRPRSDAGQRRISPTVTPAVALASYQDTKSLRASARDLDISTGTLRSLINEARAKIVSDEKTTK
jgi:hypothetical protein